MVDMEDSLGRLYRFLAPSIFRDGWFGKAFWALELACCVCMCGTVLCVLELCLVVPTDKTDVYAKI